MIGGSRSKWLGGITVLVLTLVLPRIESASACQCDNSELLWEEGIVVAGQMLEEIVSEDRSRSARRWVVENSNRFEPGAELIVYERQSNCTSRGLHGGRQFHFPSLKGDHLDSLPCYNLTWEQLSEFKQDLGIDREEKRTTSQCTGPATIAEAFDEADTVVSAVYTQGCLNTSRNRFESAMWVRVSWKGLKPGTQLIVETPTHISPLPASHHITKWPHALFLKKEGESYYLDECLMPPRPVGEDAINEARRFTDKHMQRPHDGAKQVKPHWRKSPPLSCATLTQDVFTRSPPMPPMLSRARPRKKQASETVSSSAPPSESTASRAKVPQAPGAVPPRQGRDAASCSIGGVRQSAPLLPFVLLLGSAWARRRDRLPRCRRN